MLFQSMLNRIWTSTSALLRPMKALAPQEQFVRSRVTCSKSDGKERPVLTAMQRCFRIRKRVWVKAQPGSIYGLFFLLLVYSSLLLLLFIFIFFLWILFKGYHRRMWSKPLEKRMLVNQQVICPRRESYQLEKMAAPEYRSIDIEKFVEPPFTYYQQFARQLKREKEKFHVFPWLELIFCWQKHLETTWIIYFHK